MRIRRSKTIITSEAVMIAAGMPWHRITAIVATIRPRPTFICKAKANNKINSIVQKASPNKQRWERLQS
jgi:hypothetical protein